MAGGAGTRFWPESRARNPKQFLRLIGAQSLIRDTVDRLRVLVPADRVWVATTAGLTGKVIEHLPDVSVESVVVEPTSRNTAPCIALAALEMLRRDPEATMAVMPADHVIAHAAPFCRDLQRAAALLEEEPQWLITFGIRPTYPAESFGYIERGDRFQSTAVAMGLEAAADAPAADLPVYRIRQFREKPNVERARQYLAKGNFYWNAGIFVWKARTVLDALKHHQPEWYGRLMTIQAALGTPGSVEVVRREFAAMPNISIDYAVMEHASDVLMVEASFPWDDVGSWQGLARLRGIDADGNTIAAKHIGINTTGTLVYSTDDHLVTTIGLKDLIVVHTPDATLVASKHDEESVRKLVAELRARGWGEYL